MKKLLALGMAGGIVASAMFIIQAQFKLGKPLVIKPTISSYIYQGIQNGATALRSVLDNFPKIPDMIDQNYQKLAEKRVDLRQGITSLQEIIDSLAPTKKEVEDNTLILPTIKNPLIASITTLQTTLPKLRDILQKLDDAFGVTLAERETTLSQLRGKITIAINTINTRDFFWGKTLPERMDTVVEILRGLSI